MVLKSISWSFALVAIIALGVDAYNINHNSPVVYVSEVTGHCLAMDTPEGLKNLGGDCFGIPAIHSVNKVGRYVTYEVIKSTSRSRKSRM